MANEIQATFGLTVANGNFADYIKSMTYLINQATVGGDAIAVSVPTTAGGTALSFPDVSTLGYAFMMNLDATNFVTIGPDNSGSILGFLKLKPGEMAWLRLKPGITVRALADTAAVKLYMKVYND